MLRKEGGKEKEKSIEMFLTFFQTLQLVCQQILGALLSKYIFSLIPFRHLHCFPTPSHSYLSPGLLHEPSDWFPLLSLHSLKEQPKKVLCEDINQIMLLLCKAYYSLPSHYKESQNPYKWPIRPYMIASWATTFDAPSTAPFLPLLPMAASWMVLLQGSSTSALGVSSLLAVPLLSDTSMASFFFVCL